MNMLNKDSLSGKFVALILLAVLFSIAGALLSSSTASQEEAHSKIVNPGQVAARADYLPTHQNVEYQNIKQVAAKAWLIIIFTFAVFFSAEMKFSRPAHPVQYLLIGCALLLFHLLLLAIAEHTGFDVAYIVAALATAVLVASYSWTVFDRAVFPPLTLTLFCILYGYFYFTIKRQDYALLAGSGGLFIILAAVMYLTRKVDWYSLGGTAAARATTNATLENCQGKKED